jgi:hypothetical protein
VEIDGGAGVLHLPVESASNCSICFVLFDINVSVFDDNCGNEPPRPSERGC